MLQTVEISDPTRPDHPLVINANDFDPRRHAVWTALPAPESGATVSATGPSSRRPGRKP